MFEGRTVSHGPIFFPIDLFIAKARGAKRAGHKSKGKKRGYVTYSTDRENEVCKIFIISLACVCRAQERFLFARKRLQISDTSRKQNESI